MKACSQHIPKPPSITCAYHSKLDGKSIFVKYMWILTLPPVGQICDESGEDIQPDTPPPPCVSDNGPDDWTPYNSHLKFEVADFLFCQNQMSAGDINFLLSLWAASLAVHGDEPPFLKATDMYNTIDSTPLSDLAWESFSIQYNRTQPVDNVPLWMEVEYDVWFWDPCILVHNLLFNPNFKSDFDHTPFQEHTTDGTHHFQDFMSGNWAWTQAVSFCHHLFDLILILVKGCHC
jgi:Plavaka transposase